MDRQPRRQKRRKKEFGEDKQHIYVCDIYIKNKYEIKKKHYLDETNLSNCDYNKEQQQQN